MPNVIRKRRTEQNLSQMDVARLIETTPTVVSRWESHGVKPHLFFRQRLAKLLGGEEKDYIPARYVPPPRPDFAKNSSRKSWTEDQKREAFFAQYQASEILQQMGNDKLATMVQQGYYIESATAQAWIDTLRWDKS